MKINEFLNDWKNANTEKRKELAVHIWYDWFCKTESLYNRTLKFIPFLKKLVAMKPEVGEYHVSGKNCCPCSGPLYDCMRIFDPNDDKFIGCVSFDCCWNDGKYTVMDADNIENTTDDKTEALQWLADCIK